MTVTHHHQREDDRAGAVHRLVATQWKQEVRCDLLPVLLRLDSVVSADLRSVCVCFDVSSDLRPAD